VVKGIPGALASPGSAQTRFCIEIQPFKGVV